MKVYLSGRMSGLHHDIWWVRFIWRECEVARKGYEVVNPARSIIARFQLLYKIIGYRFTLWYDLRLLKRCTHICMVGNDWHLSRGARMERMKAREWNIKLLEI